MKIKQVLLEYIRLYVNENPIDENKLCFYDFDDKKILCHDKKISVVYYPKSDVLQVADVGTEPPAIVYKTNLHDDLGMAESYIDFLLEQRRKGEI